MSHFVLWLISNNSPFAKQLFAIQFIDGIVGITIVFEFLKIQLVISIDYGISIEATLPVHTLMEIRWVNLRTVFKRHCI